MDISLCKMEKGIEMVPMAKASTPGSETIDRGRYFHHGPSLAHAALIGAGEIRNKRTGCQRRTLDDFAMVYLVAGTGWFSESGGTSQEVSAGDLILLLPGMEHSYGPTVPGQWDEYWLMCSGAVFAGFHQTGLFDPRRPVWHPGLRAPLIARFDSLVTERLTATRQPRDARVALAMEATFAAEAHLLITLLAQADAAQAPELPAWLMTACAVLDANLNRAIDMRQVARACGLAYDAFRKAFTAAMGLPPARYRLERRIDRAKAMLTAGSTPARVAEALGFCDVYFFTRQFRLVTATTPGRFCGSLAARAPQSHTQHVIT